MARLRGVAVGALSGGAASRVFAIRALGVAGPAAAAPLAELLADAHASAPERSLAATALGRLGADAGPALGRAVNAMARGTQMSDERVLARTFTPLSAALSVLAPPAEQASGTLATLADLPLPEGAPAWVRRRLIALRCGAASVLAGTASQSARLVRCDPDPHGRTGALATLRVLDRGGLTGARFDAWKGLTDAADPGVRRAAIALIPTHPEMPTVTSLLAAALGAREPGVVAEAALVLSAAPRRAANVATDGPRAADDHGEPVAPAPEIVDALARALDAARPPDQIATRAALTRAAARLGILSLKPRVERLCGSDNATLRHATEDALRLLGSPAATCNPPERHGAAAPSASPSSSAAGPAPSSRGTEPLTLTFVTDAGRIGLTLDPTLAPLAVDRIATLARSGFYDGLVIQRVVPGLVVQLGDPVGDGYGGAGKEPLPSETSPLELPSLAVGIAVGGRDTASSQIFVTLSPEPELCGDYPLAGWADPEWASASEGDIILRVETRP